MKKKIIIIAAASMLAFCLFLTGCGNKAADPGADATVKPADATTEATEAAATQVATQAPTTAPTEAPTEAPTQDPDVTPKPKLINVVLEKAATANYCENNQTCKDPAFAVDGDETTRWSGFDLGFPNYQTEFEHTLTVDLGGTFVLDSFSIIFESLTGFYEFQISDTGEDGSWTTVYTYEFSTSGPMAVQDYDIDLPKDTTAAFIRIRTDVDEDYEYSNYPYCSIYELEVLGYAKD